LLVSGSTRQSSTNNAVLATVAELAPVGSVGIVYGGLSSRPGSFKNFLDWTVGSDVVSGKRVAWINVAAPGRGLGAIATLAIVLGYIDARVLARACIDLPVAREMVHDGMVATRPERDALTRWWTTMLDELGASDDRGDLTAD
jgi:NAD(P)H-dependent FMN reductase